MISVFLFGAVVALVVLWLRGTRRARREWLRQLNLVGTWDLDSDGMTCTLRFAGNLAEGTYLVRVRDSTGIESSERGDWRVVGHTLELTTQGRTERHDLRYFDTGKIGIDGPKHEREIYIKRADNVIPLRSSP